MNVKRRRNIQKLCEDERLKEKMSVWDGQTNRNERKVLYVGLKL